MKKMTLLLIFAAAVAVMVSGCKKVQEIQCTDKIEQILVEKKGVGDSMKIKCPAGCKSGSVWGTDTYTTDSAICASAIHAGVISADKGGEVNITVVKSLPNYQGSERNGIKTSDWGSSWGDKAFTVAK